ncbi:MAG: 23S rRNA (pseudouridine(1915)-N(3))-methyltransferase RlmH [Pseudohongiellaceae bacterium]
MKINLVAVGERMPAWVEAGVQEYRKRLPGDFSLQVRPVPLARRGKNYNVDLCIKKEASSLLSQIGQDDYVVALEISGKSLDTKALANRIDRLRQEGRDLSLLVGGPDGLGKECIQRSNDLWSLSALTLPHGLVRIVVAEQLYRAWSLLQGHPYHRD